MVKWIIRAVLLLVVGGWIGGTWYVGTSLEDGTRALIRDDPSNIVEVEFDPFAEPEPEPLLDDRIWLSLVDYRRGFIASIVRLELNLRPDPEGDELKIPLLLKYHHGPIIFAGGFAVGAARMQITLDTSAERRNLPPRWGREARAEEGALVARAVVGLDGALQGKTWLQHVEIPADPLAFELERLSLVWSSDAMLSTALLSGDLDKLRLAYAGNALSIDTADMSMRANSDFAKQRFAGLLSANWKDAELEASGGKKHVDSMSFDTEYRLAKTNLDAEFSLVAEAISSAAEDPEDRERLLDYGESVLAFGALPVERLLEIWDGLRLWEPRTAALGTSDVNMQAWKTAERFMRHVSSNISTYASLKFGVDEQELLMRANAEFLGEAEVQSMTQLQTLGELFDFLLADLTYQADGELAALPELEPWIAGANQMDLLEVDNVGVSGSVHVRAGKVRLNGLEKSPREFPGQYYSTPLWSDGGAAP